ncbi:MAG: hypothetical protein JWP57_4197 [Spirosoma sp.]|nr:hypothetical protein [Spirosoma sp.]
MKFLGFIVGAIIGLTVFGSIICVPFAVTQGSTMQWLSTMSDEAVFQAMVNGGSLVNSCTIAGWSFKLGSSGVTFLG